MHRDRRKTILFLLPRLYPCATGGIEIFHYYFLQSINRLFNIYVCSECDRLPGEGMILRHYNAGSGRCLPALRRWAVQAATINFLKDRIDLIHLPYSSKQLIQDYYLPVLSRLLNTPYVLRIHGGGMHPSRPFPLHQMMFDKAAGIMAVSDPIREEYEKRHGIPIRHIPSMLPYLQSDTSGEELKRSYGLAPDDMVILFVGSIKNIKGPDILLNAFDNLGKGFIQRHRLKLVYAGDGDMRQGLVEQAEALGISGKVRTLGYIPHEKICELYKIADIFVIPSLMEARPLALSEALHNGVPSIASRIPTLESIVDDNINGLLFETQNSADLSRKLMRAIEDEGLRHRLGRTARENYRQSYQFDEMVDEYVEFYDAAIARHKRAKG